MRFTFTFTQVMNHSTLNKSVVCPIIRPLRAFDFLEAGRPYEHLF